MIYALYNKNYFINNKYQNALYLQVLIPLHPSSHWMLGELNLSTWTLTVYDSMASARSDYLTTVQQTLEKYLPEFLKHLGYWKKVKKTAKKKITVTIGYAVNVPQQPNAHDCGVFVCHFIERMLEDLHLHIDGDYTTWARLYRLRMATELYKLRVEKDGYADVS